MLELLLLLPAAIQGLAMVVDEFYYHHKRGLGRWERVGHPVDTISVIATYLPLVFGNYSALTFGTFLGIGLFSCLLVTKDEFVHTKECDPGEHWLHSLLFVVHPLVFVAAGLTWYLIHDPKAALWPYASWASVDFLQTSLVMQLAMVSVVFVYQTLYWNIIWKPRTLTQP